MSLVLATVAQAVIGLAALERLQVEKRGQPLVSGPTPAHSRLAYVGVVMWNFLSGKSKSGGALNATGPRNRRFGGLLYSNIW